MVWFWVLRYVAQGKGILQPHTLIDEVDNIVGDDEAQLKLKDGPFGEVLKSAQVNFLIRVLFVCLETNKLFN